jgi:hypothetical protein
MMALCVETLYLNLFFSFFREANLDYVKIGPNEETSGPNNNIADVSDMKGKTYIGGARPKTFSSASSDIPSKSTAKLVKSLKTKTELEKMSDVRQKGSNL